MREPRQDQEQSPNQAPETEGERLRRTVEVESGPLLPRWLSVTLWAVFLPFSLFAIFWIGRSIVDQARIQNYMQVLSGPWEGEPPAMESAVVRNGRDLFEKKARSSLLFILQRLIIGEIKDPRMARAIALRKATEWSGESRRRELFEEILGNMSMDGEMPPDYELPPRHRTTLMNLLEERQARDIVSYEQQMITRVLVWFARGRPTPPKGPERRRIRSLQNKYEKRLFVSEERSALADLTQRWAQSDEPVKQSAAEKFQLMLDAKPAELTDQEARLCRRVATEYEDRYLLGEERLTQIAAYLVKYIEKNNVFIDHPDVWDVIRLTQHRHEPARQNLKDAVYALRNRKYCHLFLSEFILKDAINPVMAVETVRLTKDEHEDLLRRENHRRRLACLDVAARIARDYCQGNLDDIDGVPAEDEREFFRKNIIDPIETVLEDERIGPRAQETLDSIKDVCSEFLQ